MRVSLRVPFLLLILTVSAILFTAAVVMDLPREGTNTGIRTTNSNQLGTAAALRAPAYPLAQLAQDAATETIQGGTYTTTGVVVDTFDCPPCPKKAVCAPCPPDSVTIALSVGNDTRVTLETDDPDFFLNGKTYRIAFVAHDGGAPIVGTVGRVTAAQRLTTSVSNANMAPQTNSIVPANTLGDRAALDAPDYPLADLAADVAAGTARTGTFSVRGVAVDTYVCPQCPKKVVCMPCPPDSVTIVESPTEVSAQVILETDEPAFFTEGATYRIGIEILTGTTLVVRGAEREQ